MNGIMGLAQGNRPMDMVGGLGRSNRQEALRRETAPVKQGQYLNPIEVADSLKRIDKAALIEYMQDPSNNGNIVNQLHGAGVETYQLLGAIKSKSSPAPVVPPMQTVAAQIVQEAIPQGMPSQGEQVITDTVSETGIAANDPQNIGMAAGGIVGYKEGGPTNAEIRALRSRIGDSASGREFVGINKRAGTYDTPEISDQIKYLQERFTPTTGGGIDDTKGQYSSINNRYRRGLKDDIRDANDYTLAQNLTDASLSRAIDGEALGLTDRDSGTAYDTYINRLKGVDGKSIDPTIFKGTELIGGPNMRPEVAADGTVIQEYFVDEFGEVQQRPNRETLGTESFTTSEKAVIEKQKKADALQNEKNKIVEDQAKEDQKNRLARSTPAVDSYLTQLEAIKKGLKYDEGLYDDLRKDIEKEKSAAVGSRLLEAGLGTLGGTSQYGLENLGKGSKSAAAGYAKDIKDINKGLRSVKTAERAEQSKDVKQFFDFNAAMAKALKSAKGKTSNELLDSAYTIVNKLVTANKLNPNLDFDNVNDYYEWYNSKVDEVHETLLAGSMGDKPRLYRASSGKTPDYGINRTGKNSVLNLASFNQ